MSAILLLLAACGSPVPFDSQPFGSIEPLDSPCGEQPVDALLALEGGRAWVGCDGGVFRTSDAGGGFEPMLASPRLEVHHLGLDVRGRVLLCGRDLAGPGPDDLLLRFRPQGGWTSLLAGDDGACTELAVRTDGALAVVGEHDMGLQVLPPGSSEWHTVQRWWLDPHHGPQRVFGLSSDGGCWHGLGADLTSPPAFLMPAGGGRCLPLRGVTVDPFLVGELWTLASPDGGDSWVAGGRDLGDEPHSRAALYRSPDGGSLWRALETPRGVAWIRDLDFSSSGSCGVAVGSLAPLGRGGVVLISLDQGRSWQRLAADVPELSVVSVLEDGFLVGGEQGFVGKGRCD